MNNIFMCMNPAKIVDLISRAQSRIVFINSGINEEVASALIIKSESIGKTNITIFTDFSEAVCQYGYGTALGFDHINDGGLDVNKIENLRIGCLLVDNDGWVFTPTPLLLEADKIIDTQPNAIKVTPDQILALLNTTAPELIKPKEKEIIKNKAIAEPEKLKGEKVTKEDIKTLTTKLEKNPLKKFDVSRKVNVFNTLIEFVELNLEGCSIGRKTVSIPSKLIIGGMDSKTQKQLKAGYKVVGSECDLTGDEPRTVPEGFNFEAYIADGNLGYSVNDEYIHLKLCFTKYDAQHLLETPLSENQQWHEDEDNNVIIEADVLDNLELRWWLQGFGNKVEVLQPIELREEFVNLAKGLAKTYLSAT